MLRTRLAQRRFAYGAAFGDLAHNNWGAEELARSTYYAERFFKDKTGVESSKNVIMRDEPAMSWGAIDALVEAGAKSFAIHHNGDHNPWRGTTTYPELFYAQGKNPANKLLVWNSPVENYCVDELDFQGGDSQEITRRISGKLMGYQRAGRDLDDGQYAPASAVDGVIGKTDEGEWASNGERNPWIRLAWPTAQTIDKVCIYDRPNPADNANGGLLSFSDGSSIKMTGIPANGAAKTVTFPAKSVTWVRFKVTQGAGPERGPVGNSKSIQDRRTSPPARRQPPLRPSAPDKHAYPYDVAMVNFTHRGDNCPMDPQVYKNIKAINDKGYAYPRIINANYDQFFDDLAAHWSQSIPVYKGTIEDWWNFGAASTAYETGINRMNHDKLSAAEYLATRGRRGGGRPLSLRGDLRRLREHGALRRAHLGFALAGGGRPVAVETQHGPGQRRRVEQGPRRCHGDNRFAHSRHRPDDRRLQQSDLGAIGPGHAIAKRPAGTLRSRRRGDRHGRRLAEARRRHGGVRGRRCAGLGLQDVPSGAAGRRSCLPPGGVTAAGNMLENKYFKVTFDNAGNVISILDKQNGNAEMVDASRHIS